MVKKVIISEDQLKVIVGYVQENDQHQSLVRRIAADLDLNYEPQMGTYKQGGEFYEKPMIMNKVSQELMMPKSLYDYMKYKYDLGDEFLQQVIDDWYNGNLENGDTLSKNVPLA